MHPNQKHSGAPGIGAQIWRSALGLALSIGVLAGSANNASAWAILQTLGLKEAKDYVKAEAAYDPDVCSNPDFPILVTISNGSNQTIYATGFELRGRYPGDSSDTYGPRMDRSQIIVEPSRVRWDCWRVPISNLYDEEEYLEQHPIDKILWSAKVLYVVWD